MLILQLRKTRNSLQVCIVVLDAPHLIFEMQGSRFRLSRLWRLRGSSFLASSTLPLRR